MQALIVFAHPEPRSFNAALRDASREVLVDAGWTVAESDLYAMKFDPVVNRSDFTTVRDANYLNVSLEQRYALEHHGLADDVRAELDKLLAADLLVLHFPLWWFGLPAILKGWIDRVFVSGGVYRRAAMYETGKLRGKRAVLCVTTGGPENVFGPGSLHGDLLDVLRNPERPRPPLRDGRRALAVLPGERAAPIRPDQRTPDTQQLSRVGFGTGFFNQHLACAPWTPGLT